MDNKIKKIRVLAYADAPTCATGFGTVSRNIFEGLYRTGRYDIDILGINFWGDPHNFPYRIWPTGTNSDKDPYGRKKVLQMIPQMEFDLLFFLQDSFILDFLPTLLPNLRTHRKTPFKSILYFPVDSVLKPEWGKNIDPADYIVAYSKFGRDQSLKVLPHREDMTVIPHGVNSAEYFPISQEEIKAFRKQYFGPFADYFIIANVNRNQQRKDIPRTIAAFKEFRKIVPNSLLYLHMAIKDQGWNLEEVCKSMELDITRDVIFPKNFGPNQGYPREILNKIYNASDVVTSTTLGEGFGLCVKPDTYVYTSSGVKKIKDITVEDKVLSSDGSYNPVRAVMARDHSGDIYEITTWLSNIPIQVSAEHGFYVYKNGDYIWKQAGNLELGDVLTFPKKYVELDNGLDIFNIVKPYLNEKQLDDLVEFNNKFKIQSRFNTNTYFIPKKITITSSLMKLFGLYLAEGCVSASAMDSVIFSFNKNEHYLLDFVEAEMKNVFGLEKYDMNTDSRGEDYNGKSIKFYSTIVANLFYALFGSGARNKKIPHVLLNQSEKLIKEFLLGEFLGDGSKEKHQLQFSTTSTNIAYGVRLMLAKLGILSSVRTSRVEYKITISGVSKEKFLKMFNMPYPDLDRKHAVERCDQNDSYLLLPVKKIEKKFYKGKLVDIQVDNTNNFVAENVIVHNSWMEAMAAKVPILMPANTMLPEFINDEVGYLCKSGSTPSLWTTIQFDNEVQRPLTDVEDMVAKLVEIHNNPEEAKRRAANGYELMTKKMEWQKNIVPQWVKVFDKAYKEMQRPASTIVTSTDAKKIIESEEF